MNPSVYLAGPITGLTYGEGSEWREDAKSQLAAYMIDAYSPLRMKQYLEKFGTLQAKQGGTYNYAGAHPLSEDKGIMTRDRNDVTKRDMVLVNLLGAERVSIGTMIEIGWADSVRTPICAVIEEENVHHHAMFDEACGYQVRTLEEAIEIVKAVLLP